MLMGRNDFQQPLSVAGRSGIGWTDGRFGRVGSLDGWTIWTGCRRSGDGGTPGCLKNGDDGDLVHVLALASPPDRVRLGVIAEWTNPLYQLSGYLV